MFSELSPTSASPQVLALEILMLIWLADKVGEHSGALTSSS